MNATRTIEEIHTTCAIAGGGPAGMMLGLLLARAGVKWWCWRSTGFSRDFRGDTIHPSTLELMHELGLSRNSSSSHTENCTTISAASERARADRPISPICHALPIRSADAAVGFS